MRIALGQIMAQTFAGNRKASWRATGALVLGTALMLSPALLSSASAQLLGYASTQPSWFPSDNMMIAPVQPADEGDGSASVVPERLKRAIVAFDTHDALVFENLRGEVGIRRRQSLREIVGRFALALMKARFNLDAEDRLRPAVVNCLLRIP